MAPTNPAVLRDTASKAVPAKAPILLVDDDERNLLALSQILEDIAEVVTAASGRDALRHLLHRDFAVILLDVYMPEMDGYEVASVIRQREQTARIPIVFLSAVNKDTEHLLRGYGMGAVDYVFKPVDPLVLKSKVATFADLYSMRQQIELKSQAEQELKEATFRARLEKLEVERELHESRARQAALLDALPIALYEVGVGDRGQLKRNFVGGDLSRLIGALAADLDSARLCWEDHIHPDDQDTLLLLDNEERDAISFEYRWAMPDSESRHFIDQCVRLRTPDGAARWVGTLVDVSERKQLEARLLQAGKLEAIGQLTGGIAHDFNNLLAAVLGGINLLERRVKFEEREAALLGQMRHAAENGAELVRRMMAFARKQDLRPELIEPQQLCRSVAGLVQHTLGGTVAIEWVCQEGESKFFVDGSQLELALVNLIINARDAMPGGGTITVTIDALSEEDRLGADLPRGDYLSIRVIDQGLGIPSDLIDRVAEPFFTTKDVGKGTGLGLSMVMGFAQQSGGKMNIRSAQGIGTEVGLILPSSERPQRAPAQPAILATALDDHRRTVLLIDDDDAVRTVLGELLSDLNFDVLSAADGLSGLKLLEANVETIDVLLTDFAMPGINGAETILRAREIKPTLFAILMTGYADDRVRIETLDAPLLRKPIGASDLQQALGASNALHAPEAHRSAREPLS